MENKKAYSKALRLLSLRSYSAEELGEKLRDCAEESDIPGIIEELERHNYINDAALAEYIAEKHLKRAKGYRYIISALEKKKIDKATVDSVKAGFDFQREFREAEDFFLKNRKKKKFPALLFSLKSRGFSVRTLQKIADKYLRTDI